MTPIPPEIFRNSLVLTGPTGSGKTSLGIQLAEQLGAEIISMDSMALFRGMNIGTAKSTPAERRAVPHHLLDVLDPWESTSVAWWLEQAADCCRRIEARGRRVLFVGGTPLYLKALIHGLFEGPSADLELRRRLTQAARVEGPLALHDRLARIDPVAAARLHPNDVRRVIRALEVYELTGKPISAWQSQWDIPPGPSAEPGARSAERNSTTSPAAPSALPAPSSALGVPRILWLDLPRKELYARIDARVEAMISLGLEKEARELRHLPNPVSREAAQAVGYREMFAYIDGQLSLPEAISRIQQRSRNLAKRQLTWFRHLPECAPASRELTFSLWGSRIG